MDISMDYNEGIMAFPIYSSGSTLAKGQGLIWGVDGSNTSTCALITCAATAADIFAILIDAPTSQASNVQTPIIYQARCRIVNNPSIIKAYYEMSTSYDLDITSSTSTIITHATSDDNLDGSWVYINAGTGIGQLRYVVGANTTTKTVNTAFTTTPDSTSAMIIIRNVGLPTAGIDLNSTFDKIVPKLQGGSGQNFVLKNFVQGPMGIKELDITLNPDLECDGLNSRGVRFFSLIVMGDTKLAAKG